MRTITHTVSQKTFVVGSRKRPDPEKIKRALHMDRYMVAVPPIPPARTYYSRAAAMSLSDIMGNDLEGD